jgi:hypothetical protein
MVDMVDGTGSPRKEVIATPNQTKRRPGCNRAAHDPE